MDAVIERKLREGRSLLIQRDAVRFGAWFTVGAVGLWLLLALVAWRYPAVPWSILSAGIVVVMAWAVASLVSALRWRKQDEVALALDATRTTKDRFVTALELAGNGGEALRHELAAFARDYRFPNILKPRAPRLPVALTLAGIVLIVGVATLDHFRRTGLQPDVAKAGSLLEQARREVAKVAPPESPLRKEEEKLEEARKQLGNSTDPMRDALRAIADLEKRLASASASPLTDEEKEALAKALAENEPQAAQALSSGNDREAAEQIAQMDPEALAKALEQAAQHRENSRLQELARKAAEQARRELAQGLASAGNSGAQRRLQQALREMKAGGQGQQQQGQGQGTELALGKGGEKQDGSAPEDNAPPGGSPGSEHDEGRGEDIKSEKDALAAKGSDEQLTGEMGQGQSRVNTYSTSGGDNARSARATRDGGATQSAELDTVTSENIPPGSRILVKRYFESVRPKE
ncbi:hypothetical protein DB345_12160 [Spartobacteria bacterium LR76]|nr:hypothetical protein DB345_12160 [Spartobacteria bacterium LR76]